VIIHELKITCRGEDGGVREIFLGLDKQDLEDLKEVVLRAEKKYLLEKRGLVRRAIRVLARRSTEHKPAL